MTVEIEDVRLSANEQAVWQTFRCKCVMDGITQFSSDNFRLCKVEVDGKKISLDKVLYGDTKSSVGLLFWKKSRLGHIRKVGYVNSVIPMNHGREIKLYEFALGAEASR